MNLGIFGGSFDPPHVSHVLACLWALETGALDRIFVIPCLRHALGKQPAASFEDRVEMCRLAVARLERWVEVLDIEGRRNEVSYTIDTIRLLQAKRPGHCWRLLIGEDILEQAPRWKMWEEVVRLAPPLVVPRMVGERPGNSGAEASSNGESSFAQSRAPENQPPPDLRALSSTWLRERLAEGEIPEGVLPNSVAAFIRRRGLYGFHPLPSSPDTVS